MNLRIDSKRWLALAAAAMLLVTTACDSTPATQSSSQSDSASSAPDVDAKQPVKAGEATGFELAIPLQFDIAKQFSEGLAVVGTKSGEKDGYPTFAYHVIDKSGKTVFELPAEVNGTEPFSGGKMRVYRPAGEGYQTEYNFVDTTGKLLLDSWLTDTRGMGGGGYISRLIPFRDASVVNWLPKYWTAEDPAKGAALMDSDLNTIIPYGEYPSIYWIPDTDFVSVSMLDRNVSGLMAPIVSGIIKVDGSVVVPIENSFINYVDNIGFEIHKEQDSPGELMLLDGTIVKLENADTYSFSSLGRDDAVAFSANDLWGVMDLSGKVLVEPTHPDANMIPGYEYAPWENSPNAINSPDAPKVPDGMVLLGYNDDSCVFATADELDPTTYLLAPDVQVGLADRSGKVLAEPKLAAASLMVQGVYLTAADLVTEGENGPAYIDMQVVLADGSLRSDSYDEIAHLADGMIAVCKDGKYGYIGLKM